MIEQASNEPQHENTVESSNLVKVEREDTSSPLYNQLSEGAEVSGDLASLNSPLENHFKADSDSEKVENAAKIEDEKRCSNEPELQNEPLAAIDENKSMEVVDEVAQPEEPDMPLNIQCDNEVPSHDQANFSSTKEYVTELINNVIKSAIEELDEENEDQTEIDGQDKTPSVSVQEESKFEPTPLTSESNENEFNYLNSDENLRESTEEAKEQHVRVYPFRIYGSANDCNASVEINPSNQELLSDTFKAVLYSVISKNPDVDELFMTFTDRNCESEELPYKPELPEDVLPDLFKLVLYSSMQDCSGMPIIGLISSLKSMPFELTMSGFTVSTAISIAGEISSSEEFRNSICILRFEDIKGPINKDLLDKVSNWQSLESLSLSNCKELDNGLFSAPYNGFPILKQVGMSIDHKFTQDQVQRSFPNNSLRIPLS